MKIGVFGGTYDPIHTAHLIVAEAAREAVALDRVIWIPSFRPPHKEAIRITEFRHRMAMVSLAIAGNAAFSVSDVETRLDGPSYTTNTLDRLSREIPDAEWYLILGEDSLCELHLWRNPEKLCEQARFVVFSRSDADRSRVDPSLLRNCTFLEFPEIGISATEIRRRVSEKRSIRYLVPDSVREYIRRENLYCP